MWLHADVEAHLVAHARDEAPRECCGLLFGRADEILAARRARNVADDPERRYVIEPRDHLSAIRDARAAGLDVIGAYHSHPRTRAVPSPTDAAQAFPDFLWVIVGLGGDAPEVAGWAWSDGNFTPVPLVRSREGTG